MADAREAFAEHYLTDSFSGRHTRVRRADIIGWYRVNFAPKAADHFERTMRARIVDAITAQISQQTSWADFIVPSRVADYMQPDGSARGVTRRTGPHGEKWTTRKAATATLEAGRTCGCT